MYQHFETKNRIALKAHRCDWCGEIIEKGEQYEWQKFMYEGRFCEWFCHLHCSRIASAIWDYADPDDGMDADLFQESCADVCREFICPDCKDWNDEFHDCEMDKSYCLDKMDAFFQTHELYREQRKSYYEIWKCRDKKI